MAKITQIIDGVDKTNQGVGIGEPIFSGTSGSILFVDSNLNLGQNNSNLFWDNVNNRLGVGTTSPSGKLHVKRTWEPQSGVEFLSLNEASVNPQPATVNIASYNLLTNTGSEVGGVGHNVACIGWTQDTTSGNFTNYGVEGRSDGKANNTYGGVFGLSRFNGNDTTFTGICAGVMGRIEIVKTDDSTPLSQGVGVAFWAPTITGGALKYSFLGEDPMQVNNDITSKKSSAQGYLYAYGTGGTSYIRMYHDNSSAYVESNVNQLILKPANNGYVVLDNNGLGIIPLTANSKNLGIAGFEWNKLYVNEIVSANDLLISCGTAKTLELQESVWDDQQVALGAVSLGASAPTRTAYRSGEVLAFSKNQDNCITFTAQLTHKYKTGSDIEFHVHVTPTDNTAGAVRWQLTYSWADVDSAFPAETTLLGTQTIAINSQDDHLYFDLEALTGSSNGVSSILICSLCRLGTDAADTYDNDIYLTALDFHIEIDTMGSRTELTK